MQTQNSQHFQGNDPLHASPHQELSGPGRVEVPPRVWAIVGIIAAVILTGILVWLLSQVLLLIFTGVLLAVVLHSLSAWVQEQASLSKGWSLTVVIGVLLLVIGLGAWLLAPRLSEQFDQLTQQLPRSIQQVEHYLAQYRWGQWLLAQTPQPRQLLSGETEVLTQAAGIFSSFFNIVAGILIILFTGLFLAAEPRLYIDGLLHLVPLRKRQRVHEVLQQMGHALRWWLVGQACSMTIVAALTILGLWLLNIQLALTLGLLAGLLEFIPQFGPILSAIPAALLALLQGPTQAAFVVVLYLGIQTVESYLIFPLIQERMVSLPPALTITALAIFGVLAGFLGVLIATPLLVCLMVLVQTLYVKDTLGDSVAVLGSNK